MDTATTFIVGRLTRDPMFYGEEKKRRALFSVAVNRGRGDTKKTTFVDCIAWGRRSELLDGINKGQTVMVQGDLETDSYEKKDGTGRVTRLQVNVNTFMAGQPSSGVDAAQNGEDDVDSEEVVDISSDAAATSDVPF
jgi:single-strand DNA-binding protein